MSRTARHLPTIVRRFLASETGASPAEYALAVGLLGFVAAAVVLGAARLSQKVNASLHASGDAIAGS